MEDAQFGGKSKRCSDEVETRDLLMNWTSEKDQLLRGSMHCCRGERARMPTAMDCYVIISYAQKEHWQGRDILRTAFMLHFGFCTPDRILLPWIILRNKSRRIPSILFSLSLSLSLEEILYLQITPCCIWRALFV